MLHNIKKFLFQKITVKYHLHSINIENGKATFFLKNKSKPLVVSFDSLINDADIILCMNIFEACYLGGYYGKFIYQKQQKSKSNENRNLSLMSNLHLKVGRFKIISTNRVGEIKYCDQKLNKFHYEYPHEIVESRYKVENFSPVQAFYIGYLASTYLLENLNKKDLVRRKKHLMLVS